MPRRRMGNRGITPRILNLISRWALAVIVTSRPLHPSVGCRFGPNGEYKCLGPAGIEQRFFRRGASSLVTMLTEQCRFMSH